MSAYSWTMVEHISEQAAGQISIACVTAALPKRKIRDTTINGNTQMLSPIFFFRAGQL